MKNIVVFDKDTERDEQVIVTKLEGTKQPTSEIEAKSMIIEDISTATQGLMLLVKIANDSGYINEDDSARLIVEYFSEAFLNKENK